MDEALSKAYQADLHEDTIYQKWEQSGVFSPKIDHSKKPFVISMPPPNATGSLHLGHASMLAIEDIMIRYHRMKGTPALWVPGTDHASIATQNKVEKLIAEKGESRHSLGKEAFLKKVDEFVENSKDNIRNQMRKMGASCDWSRERYTLDKGLSKAVQEVFVRMYGDGLIYRGDRIVNWCTRCSSTLSDDEVEYKEQSAKLYFFTYDENFPITIATTRPETKLGDTAVAVHPEDERYKQYIGKTYTVSFAEGKPREIKVIADSQIDPTFGTGALGVTPAHSQIDFEMGQKNKLENISVITQDGTINKMHPTFGGMDVKEAKKAIIKWIEENNLMKETKDIRNNLSICYRCGTTVEPLISKQWFIDVNKKFRKGKSIKDISIEAVKSGKIKILPDHFNKTYFHWMENLRDWCISRQIWFGHQVPVWYCQSCGETIVQTETASACTKCKSTDLKQDPDTLDTWFSSGLWTFSTLGWPEQTEDLKYFHPTSVLETGYDILFFWVARMIIMTGYALDDIPFKTVYLHGLVRDKQGRKMSKSLGNGIDPLDMIAQYGTDAVRLSLVMGGSPGNDIRLYEEKIAGFRNFVNKIWNAARFALMNVSEEDKKKTFQPDDIKSHADKWVMTRLQYLIKDVTKDFEEYKFSEAGTKIYDFTWGYYCDWYLEMTKGDHMNPAVLLYVLKSLLKLLHPFTPFITETLWQQIEPKSMLISAEWPIYNQSFVFVKEEQETTQIHNIITLLRTLRSEYSIPPDKKMDVTIHGGEMTQIIKDKSEPIKRLSKIGELGIMEKGEKVPHSLTAVTGNIKIYIPFQGLFDFEKELQRMKKQVEEKEKEFQMLSGKLNNQGFVKNAAPELIEQTTTRVNELKKEIENLSEHIKVLKENM